jgi:Tol biopolymer transport system component
VLGEVEAHIKSFGASPNGKCIAYVTEKVEAKKPRQQVWLRTPGKTDQLLLTSEQLEAINSAYGARVVGLSWSPSGRFLSVSVHDNDVSIVTAVYDLTEKTYESLNPEGDGSSDARWHPSKDLLFFAAVEGSIPGHERAIFQYDPQGQKTVRIDLTGELIDYQAVRDGLVLKVREWSEGKDGYLQYRDEFVFLPYVSFRKSQPPTREKHNHP